MIVSIPLTYYISCVILETVNLSGLLASTQDCTLSCGAEKTRAYKQESSYWVVATGS